MNNLEFPESEAYFANMEIQPKNLTKTFWGVKVSPIEPVTVNFHNHPQKSLYICQATLGELCLEDLLPDGRSVLSLKYGDNPEVLLCSLHVKRMETTALDLDFAGPSDAVFSVEGPFDIHLVGYIYDVVPPQTLGNEEGSVASTSLHASSSENQLTSLGGGDTCKLSAESAPNPDLLSHLPLLNIPNLSHLRAVDVVDGLNKIRMDGSINMLLQGLTVAQIEAFRDSMVDKLQETNSVRRKLDYRVMNEVEARVIGHTEKSGFSGNEVEERVEQENGVRGNDVEAEMEHVATHGTTHVVDTNEESGVNGNGVERSTGQGSPDHYMLPSRKSKRLKREEEEGEENGDHIRSTKHDSVQNPLLDSKEARRLKKKLKKQKHAEDDDTRSTQHGLLDDSEVDTKEAKNARKKRKKDAREEARSTKHDSVQNPLLDSKEAKRLKKKLKKQKHTEDDDTRASNDGLQMPTYSEDDSMRSSQHGLPEDSAVDTRDAKQARKKKKDAKEDVRAANDGLQTPASDTVQTKKHIIGDANIRSHEAGRVIVVCALRCQSKR